MSTGVRPLATPDADAGRALGRFAADLGALVTAGVDVPAGFVVEPEPEPGGTEVGAPLRARIARAYSALGISPGGRPLVVSVRPSVVGLDVAGHPAAGRSDVRGHDELVAAVERCRAHAPGPVAVVVQEAVAAQQGGTAHTVDPGTGADGYVVIEAVLGRGEMLRAREVEPDLYVVDVHGLGVVSARVGHQTHQLVRGRDGHDLRVGVDPWRAGARVLADAAAEAVARVAWRVRELLGGARDVEWARRAGRTWVLGTWPSDLSAVVGAANLRRVGPAV